MNPELLGFLSRYLDVNEALAAAFEEAALVRSFPKGTILLREGEQVRESYFILKGCVRGYVLKEGDDRTIGIHVEEDPVIPLGYGGEAPSEQFLECLEDTVAVVASPEREAQMLAEHPELKAACLALSEAMSGRLGESLARYRSSSPQERYAELAARRPDLLRRIPQYILASYVGVRPESLSRIRSRLARTGAKGEARDRS